MLKVLGISMLMAVAYCQEHQHSHITSHKTVVTHEVPKNTEHYHYHESEDKDYGSTDFDNNVLSQNLVHYKTGDELTNLNDQESPFLKPHIPPSKPAPVYESQEPVRAPVHLKIIQQEIPHAQHRVLQLVKQPLNKPKVIKVPSFVPVLHQVPIAPIVHHAANAPVTHQAAIAPVILQAAVAPVHQSSPQYHTPEVTHRAPIEHHVNEEFHSEPVQNHFNEHSHNEQRHGHHDYDYYAYPKYEYAYEVKDPHTHDIKYHHESRDGDVVKGVYSLQEPDGSTRTVNYGSDKKTGFNADITHKGHTKHVIPHYQH